VTTNMTETNVPLTLQTNRWKETTLAKGFKMQ